MAKSPSHVFGQLIGGVFENTFHDIIQDFCNQRGLYLDKKGIRQARKANKKISWQDKFGSTHDLDFVIEKNGTVNKIGDPIAFIESAWRRYTKHSRNKVQEIEGALLPLSETYSHLHPFLGAILSGEFTENAMNQLKGQGFKVLHIPYAEMVECMKAVNINAAWEEDTPHSELDAKIAAWSKLSQADIQKLKDTIHQRNAKKVKDFMTSLADSIDRRLESVIIIPLYGQMFSLGSITEAIDFIVNYNNSEEKTLQKFEVEIRYSNGDTIRASFSVAKRVKEFLETYK